MDAAQIVSPPPGAPTMTFDDSPRPWRYAIADATGELVASGETPRGEVQVPDLPPGDYKITWWRGGICWGEHGLRVADPVGVQGPF